MQSHLNITAAAMLWLGAALANAGLASAGDVIPLKEAKLNIEYNATDDDTGFQGFIDSEGRRSLVISGPGGEVLRFEGLGKLASHGLTELFFETVEPAGADMPIEAVLAVLPEGEYAISGEAIEAGVVGGATSGVAWLTHDIPAGPVLTSPAEDAVVPVGDLVASWSEVTMTITGEPVEIIAYQLIIEKDGEPHPEMIGNFGLSMYLPASVFEIRVPAGFLEPATSYAWEVLAIEVSGNQTLSSSAFRTE
ncbi:MAG: hypothetical protein WD017_04100 [Cucumibacter sp.]